MSEIAEEIKTAMKASENWAKGGWTMTFGNNNAEVSSLSAAEEAPESFVYRQEALAYWFHVNEMGIECKRQGEKALDAVKNNDLSKAADAVYFAMFTEKKINKKAPTWGVLSEKLHQMVQA